MQNRREIERPTPTLIASYVKKNAAKAKAAQAGHAMRMESIREADYEGHHIVIRTTYKITVDGILIRGHMGVTNDGQVHYHPIPNVSFDSAVDLVKRLIDVFPDDFVPRARKRVASGHKKMKKGASSPKKKVAKKRRPSKAKARKARK